MQDLKIDYGDIPAVAQTTLSQEEWDPPRHVYFGKKDGRGKMEKEPIYQHVEYPRLMYSLQGDTIRAKLVHSDAEVSALGSGWEKNPSAFGYLNAPSIEQIRERELASMTEAVADTKAEPAARRGRTPAH